MTFTPDPLQRLISGDPAPHRRPSPESAARIDEAVGRAFAEDAPAVPSRHRCRPARRVATVGVATAAIAAGAIAVPLPPATTPGVTSANARSVLHDAARAALREPGTGRWRYLRVTERVTHVRPLVTGTARAIVPRTVETWVAPSGTERRRIVAAGPVRYPTPSDEAAYADVGAPGVGPGEGAVVELDTSPHRRPVGAPAELPSSAERLADRLRTAPRLRGASMPARIALLLRDAATPPRVRAALLEVLRGLPDVELRPAVRDLAGRTGDAVVVRDGEATTTFVFAPDRELLAIRTQGDPRRDPGVDDWQLLVARGRRAEAPRATLRESPAPPAGAGAATPAPQLVPLEPR